MSDDSDKPRMSARRPALTAARRRHAYNFYVMGQQRAEEGAIDEATRLFRRALSYDPDSTPTLQAMVHIEFANGNLGAARDYLNRALALGNPPDIELLFQLGNLEISEGDPAAAVEAYQRAARLGDPSPELIFNLGIANLLAGRAEESAETLTRLVKLQPMHERAWDGLGCARGKLKDYSGAINAFMRALQIDPALNDARDHLAQLLLEMGNTRRAQQVLCAALDIDAHRASSRHLLGVAYAAAKEYEQATICWEQLIAQGQAVPETYHLLANAYLQLGNNPRACQVLEVLVALFPDHLSGHLQLALLLFEQGEHRKGWHHLELARALDPHNPAVVHVLSTAQRYQDRQRPAD